LYAVQRLQKPVELRDAVRAMASLVERASGG